VSVAISGGRDYPSQDQVTALLRVLLPDIPVVVGDCPTGVDRWVREWHGYDLDHPNVYRALWHTLGKAAGPVRNHHMLHDGKAELLIAFDSGGPGTASAIREAKALGITFLRVTP
jgi:hypothetical protein